MTERRRDNVQNSVHDKRNYERAAEACFDWLVGRSEVDGDRLAVS